MGRISERIADIARRCGDLSPLQEPVRQVLTEDNTHRALAGIDVQGRPFAPLARSTLLHRRGSGPPLAPRSASSRIVTDYTVQVTTGMGRLTFAASWPGIPWMECHHTGTARMPKRDAYGFRQVALDKIRDMMSGYVMQGSVTAPGGGSTGGGGGAGATAPVAAPRPSLLDRGRRAVAHAAKTVFGWPRRRPAAT